MMRHVMPAIALASVLLSSCAASAEVVLENEVTPYEAYQRQSQGVAILLDVRTVREFERGHIAGAVNIPLDEVSSRVQELHRLIGGREVILYCRSGRRASIAERILRQRGVTNISHLNGQYAGWAAAGLPVSES